MEAQEIDRSDRCELRGPGIDPFEFKEFEEDWNSNNDNAQIMKEIQTAVQDVPTKIYKIKYTLNVLPGMLEEDDGTLMDTAG